VASVYITIYRTSLSPYGYGQSAVRYRSQSHIECRVRIPRNIELLPLLYYLLLV